MIFYLLFLLLGIAWVVKSRRKPKGRWRNPPKGSYSDIRKQYRRHQKRYGSRVNERNMPRRN